MSIQNFNIGHIQNSNSLTHSLVESLRAKIFEGNLKPGTKLPSAKEIEEQAGVSRSVVREAVSALKAEGLVVSRQGVGVFVTSNVSKQKFEIEDEEFSSIEDALQILELRMAVEIEMAYMAAKNRTKKQMQTIWKCLEAFDKQVASGNDAVKEDLDFHLSVANASGNPYFARFIKYIGEGVIPAREIITNFEKSFDSEGYLHIIQKEHQKIAQAIEQQNCEAAQEAVRDHLGNSRERHLNIVKSYKKSIKKK